MEKNSMKLWSVLPMNMRPKVRYWLPAAAMDKEDLKAEINQLYQRGFGGVEIVVLAMLPQEIARGEDGWGTPHWDEMVDVIAETTKELGMTMDIANGPAWPISVPGIESANDQAVLWELTWGEAVPGETAAWEGELPAPGRNHEEGHAVLVAAMAWLETGERILKEGSYIDLMPYLERMYTSQGKMTYKDREGYTWDHYRLTYTFPEAEEGKWKIFAFYRQPACQKTNAGQCYVIDHLGKAGAKACERYWDTVFKDRQYASMESFFCDSLEYDVAMEWTPHMPEEFYSRRGYSILPWLPFVGMADTFPACDIPGYTLDRPGISEMVNYDFKEVLTQCYCENHLSVLENMAGKYGKTIRYQVAYNKPFEVERCGLYVSIPENEALGRPAVDFQKTMAAAAHLGRKERYSFECAAEFGHSYGQDYEDLFWWIKRSLMAGMNAQVLHGASYSGKYTGKYSVHGQLPQTQWPGFEAFGKFVSNYWNRTLSVSDARGCLDAVTRLNMIFRKKARVDCAIFRNDYGSDGLGSEFCIYKDQGRLSNRGYSYETVTESLLALPVCTVTDSILDQDGVGYKCLIIPRMKFMSLTSMNRILELASHGLRIVWEGDKPEFSLFYNEWDTPQKERSWRECLELLWKHDHVIHVNCVDEIPDILENLGIIPEIRLEGKMDVMTASYHDKENYMRYDILYGYNRARYTPDDPNPDELAVSAIYQKGSIKGSYTRPGAVSRQKISVSLNGCGKVWVCNPWNGKMDAADFKYNGSGRMTGQIEIEEDEMIILAVEEAAANETTDSEATADEMVMDEMVATETLEGNEKHMDWLPVAFHTLELRVFEGESPEEFSFLRSRFSQNEVTMKIDCLKPWRQLDGKLEHFAGQGVYLGIVKITDYNPTQRYMLCLGEVCDTFTVYINNQAADFPDQVMKQVDISGLLHEGDNEVRVIVTSNLYNRLFSEGMCFGPMKLSCIPRNYGIWESEYKKIGVRIG